MNDLTTTPPPAIRDFCGYGTLDADLWFLGIEESTGERPRSAEWSFDFEVAIRENWQPVMDARVACDALRDRYWLSNGYSSVWKFMAKLARGVLERARDWRDTLQARTYVVEALGRHTGNTLLGELLPLPAPGTGAWPALYREWYPDRDTYGEIEYPRRARMWRDLIERHEPKVVCCYGRGTANAQWARYQALFETSEWRSLASGRVLTADWSTTTVYLLPFFGQGQLRLSDLQAVIEDVHPDLREHETEVD